MAISGPPPFLALVTLLTLCACTAAQTVSLAVMRSLSEDQPSKVALVCSTDSSLSLVEFYRRVGSNIDRVIGNSSAIGDRVELNFDLTPEREGYYYCQVGNTRSDQQVELVAYPIIDPMVSARTVYPTPPGSDVIIDCPYKPGVLRDHYSVSWSRGLTPVNLDAPEFSRYSILDDFSLMVNSTVPDDAKAYSCKVEVTIVGEVIRKYGPPVALEVTDPIRIIQPISDNAILPGQDALFRCTAVGVPQPHIKWLIGSAEVEGDRNPVVTSTLNSITVESSLRLTSVEETQNGPVSCVAYHSYEGEVFVAISTANLVVLTDNFDATLTSETNGNVRLQATLPAAVPGVFSLIVQFIFNIAIIQEREIIHPSFKNSMNIDIIIPDDQLPQFRQFGVKVALKFDGMRGGLTSESNKITLPTGLPSKITGGECECPQFTASPDSSSSNTTVYALISVFIILVVVLLIIGAALLAVCVHHTYRKDVNHTLSPSPLAYRHESVKRGDSQGTFSRSESRSSYNSDHSRSSGRSRGSNHSGHSGRSSHSSRSSRSSLSRGTSHTWSHGTLDSVKESISGNHKDLTQWGGLEKESLASPVSPVSPDVDTLSKNNEYVDIEPTHSRDEVFDTGLPQHREEVFHASLPQPHSREEVFHTSLPHATNPTSFVIKYAKEKLRQSDSSYEDMDLDETPLPRQAPFKTK